MSGPDVGEAPPLPSKNRSAVLRDLLVFQLKLFVDGVKDLILSPVSLIAGLIGLVADKQPGDLFYRTLRTGKRIEHWIDLFGAAYRKEHPQDGPSEPNQSQDFDTLVDRLQTSLLDPQERAKLSGESRKRLDAIVRKMRKDNPG